MPQVLLILTQTGPSLTANGTEVTTYLGLGGNLGDPLAAFVRTRTALAAHPRILNCRSSALYRTPPVGGPPDQPDYLNAVLALQTSLGPGEMLRFCLGLELAEKRERTQHWGPRTLDIDLLLYADRVIQRKDLEVPHPRLQDRLFVLLPLADLAPDLRHPVSGQTIRGLIKHLPEDKRIRIVNLNW